MISKLIEAALRKRFIVLMIAAALVIYGAYALKTTPVDAIPDLSENQVIIFTEWMGRSPQIIEDQVTYPIASEMLKVPGAVSAGSGREVL